MKFSWQILNYLIDLTTIPFNIFEEQLTLAGLEIEKVEYKKEVSDQIIDLNITANRRDISSIASLATEISAIFNIPLKIKYKTHYIYNKNKINNFIELSNDILYYKLNIIKNTIYNTSPKWLKNHLFTYDIESKNIFHDITKYIKIKWGQNILIINAFNYESLKSFLIKKDNTKNLFKQVNQNNNSMIVYFPIYNHKLEYNIQNNTENFINAYDETIRLITSFTKSTISKSQEFFNKELQKNTKLIILNQIKINKNVIQKTLGPIKKTNLQFLSIKQIFLTLDQLKLNPLYIKKYKKFIITIPQPRIYDLKRQIDIIEEIGRIYGFKNFLNKLPKTIKKGHITKKSYNINRIAYNLRNIGFTEVINFSLKKNINNQSSNIKLYNPTTEEQKELRNNIIEGLIENFNYNIKQKNSNITIFEIGKIFYRTQKLRYIEEIHLGGIIHNQNCIRQNWKDKTENFNWFHAKGIIELFFEKLKIQIEWKKLNNNIKTNLYHLINPIKQIGIYSSLNKEYLGILSELNKKYIENIEKYDHSIYFFNISIEKLNKLIQNNKHLKYIMKPYSTYPSVIRDINIQVNKYQNLNEIPRKFIEDKEYFIESVDIISEYYNKILKKRSICLRITYRSNNRTLNNRDLYNIDKNIQKYLHNINKE